MAWSLVFWGRATNNDLDEGLEEKDDGDDDKD